VFMLKPQRRSSSAVVPFPVCAGSRYLGRVVELRVLGQAPLLTARTGGARGPGKLRRSLLRGGASGARWLTCRRAAGLIGQ